MSKFLFATAVLLVAALLLVPVAAGAEVTKEVGVKSGLSIADLMGDNTNDVNARTAFAGGAFAQFGFTESFALRFEVLYSMKGGTNSFDYGGTTIDETLKFDYIEIPILAVGTFPVNDVFATSIFGGPAIGFNSKAEYAVEGGGQSASMDVSDQVESTDFGAVLGAGGSFAVGAVNILLEARYTMGFTDVIKGSGTQRNGAFGIMAGLSFPLAR